MSCSGVIFFVTASHTMGLINTKKRNLLINALYMRLVDECEFKADPKNNLAKISTTRLLLCGQKREGVCMKSWQDQTKSYTAQLAPGAFTHKKRKQNFITQSISVYIICNVYRWKVSHHA